MRASLGELARLHAYFAIGTSVQGPPGIVMRVWATDVEWLLSRNHRQTTKRSFTIELVRDVEVLLPFIDGITFCNLVRRAAICPADMERVSVKVCLTPTVLVHAQIRRHLRLENNEYRRVS